VRAFVTGGTGFIGGRVIDALLRHGHEVVALVRSPERATHLRDRGTTVVAGDVTDAESVRAAINGADTVFHIAAYYALGVDDRDAMFRTNVGGTENVLTATRDAGTPKVVYCSSQAALGGGPPGSVGDETREHSGAFGSVYEESKWRAHQAARDHAAKGLDVVSVMPCAVYGPDDVSFLGVLLRLYAKRRLLVCSFRDSTVSWVHVDDVADGIVRAAENGRPGEDYVLGGDNETIGGMLARLEPITGIRPPRIWVPLGLMRASLPIGPLMSRLMGQASGAVRDGYRTLETSIAFSSAKAERELGYKHRSIEEGMPPVIAALAAG
jgi:dihydroflavonol-4-reductase